LHRTRDGGDVYRLARLHRFASPTPASACEPPTNHRDVIDPRDVAGVALRCTRGTSIAVALPGGAVWVSDDYGPYVTHVGQDG